MGLGRRTFAPGEVLTASNVMNYLMDQSVMNFAGTAARGSAIGTAVAEGMVSYLNDTDRLEVYRAIGTAAPGWQPIAFESYADARSGLVPIVPTSVVIATGSGSANALGQVSFTGVTSVSLNGVFTTAYNNYRFVIKVRGASSGTTGINTRFRASGTNTSTGYYWSGYIAYVAANTLSSYRGNNSTEFLSGFFSGSSYAYGSVDVLSPMLAEPTGFVTQSTGSDGNYFSLNNSGFQIDNTLFDGITFSTSSNTMTGTVTIYGYND